MRRLLYRIYNQLKVLKKKKLRTYAFVSPIIPVLIDLEEVIAETKDLVDYYWFEFINLRGAGKEFAENLKAKFPKSYQVAADKEKFARFLG